MERLGDHRESLSELSGIEVETVQIPFDSREEEPELTVLMLVSMKDVRAVLIEKLGDTGDDPPAVGTIDQQNGGALQNDTPLLDSCREGMRLPHPARWAHIINYQGILRNTSEALCRGHTRGYDTTECLNLSESHVRFNSAGQFTTRMTSECWDSPALSNRKRWPSGVTS